MGVLLGANIGQNYKGILNLNTLNGNLSGTLQAVTDGDGNASPLQLSTTNVEINNNFKVQRTGDIYTFGEFNTGGGFFEQKYGDGSGEVGFFNRYSTGWWLSNSIAISGSYTAPSARLHVRGDGTNPIARFENSAGTNSFIINNTGDTYSLGSGNNVMYIVNQNGSSTINGKALSWWANIDTLAGYCFGFNDFNSHTYTSGIGGMLSIANATFAAGAGSANFRPLSLTYTINNSGAQTGTATGIFLNATETALNGMTHNLMDLQVGGVSRFRVNNATGELFINAKSTLTFASALDIGYTAGTHHTRLFYNSGNIALGINGANGLVYLQGTTNAFPALKRNGAALEVRLADDSGFADLSCGSLVANGTSTIENVRISNINDLTNSITAINIVSTSGNLRLFTPSLFAASGTINASARVQIDSTTQGFLPPRQTEAQRLAIAGGTPAIGLMVYQTDGTDGLYVYKAGGWQFIA